MEIFGDTINLVNKFFKIEIMNDQVIIRCKLNEKYKINKQDVINFSLNFINSSS